MRHKALPLPGQLPLDIDATEEEPGDIEAGDLAANDRDRTPNRSDLVQMPSPLIGMGSVKRDAFS